MLRRGHATEEVLENVVLFKGSASECVRATHVLVTAHVSDYIRNTTGVTFALPSSSSLLLFTPSVVSGRITKEKEGKKSENKTHHLSMKDPEGFGALKNKANLKVI